MRNVRIWVLVTDGIVARICSSCDGMTTAITVPENVASGGLEGPAGEMSRAWYRFETGCGFLRGPKVQFAGYLAQILGEAAAERAYDGLIVIATPQIADELERALDPQTRALLIGDVVKDLPVTVPAKPPAHVELLQ